MEHKIISRSPADTALAAKAWAEQLLPGDFVAIEGEMGAGKTTFMSAALRALGKEFAGSPTYTLVNEYGCEKFMLFHFDFYRLETYDDLESIGFYDYPGDGRVLVAEWSERFPDLGYNKKVSILKTGEDEREIVFSSLPRV